MTHTIIILELNEQEKEQIRQRMPEMTESCFSDFIELLDKLIHFQVLAQLNKKKDDLTPKELKAELQKIRKHYEEAARGLRFMTRHGISPRVIDQHYFLASHNQPRKLRNFELGIKLHPVVSYVERETINLINTVKSFESDIVISKGRQKSVQFQVFIIEIAKFFDQHLPDSAISDYPDTHFSKVVKYLLSEALASRLTTSDSKRILDPQRHITKALKEFKSIQSC